MLCNRIQQYGRAIRPQNLWLCHGRVGSFKLGSYDDIGKVYFWRGEMPLTLQDTSGAFFVKPTPVRIVVAYLERLGRPCESKGATYIGVGA